MTKINQKWLNWREIIISDQGLSFGEKALGLYLNTYMNGKQDFAFPSIATICGEMSLGSNKTAIKYLSGLAEKGYLTKEKRYGNSIIYHTSFPEKILSSVNATLLEEVHDSSVRGTPTVVYEVHTNNQMNKQINNSSKFSDEDRKFAEYFAERISRLPGQKKKTGLDKWADTIRLMRERDGRCHREMKEVFDWAHGDDFWRTNILSPAKLRVQWGQLVLKRDSARKKNGGGADSPSSEIFAI